MVKIMFRPIIDQRRYYIARANAGLANKDLIKKAGISQKVIDRIGSGKWVQAVTVGKIAKALGVSVEYLLSDEAPK